MAGTHDDTDAAQPPATLADSARSTTPWLLALLCFVLPAVPVYVVLAGPLKGNGSPARLLSVIMLGLVALGFVVIRRTGPTRRINPGVLILLTYLLLWLITYGVGVMSADNYTISTNRTRALIALVCHVGVGLYVLGRVRTPRDHRIVLGSLLAGLAFACLVGFLQGVSSVDLRYLFQPPGFVLNTDDLQLSERAGAARVRGTSQHPIEFSVLAAITLPLALYMAQTARTRNAKVAAGVAAVIAVLALPASISRTGIIAVGAAMAFYMLAFKVRQIAPAVAALVIAIACYAAAFPTIMNALWSTISGSSEDASIEGRTKDYASVAELLRSHPLFGVGLGGSEPTVFGYLDNEWMQSVVQGGLVGLTAMTLLMVGAVFGIAASLRRAGSREERVRSYMLGAIAIGILTSSFTFDLFSFEQTALVFFIVFALLWAPFTVPADRSEIG
ncbi:polymerase [Mycolicibacterium confluentis]|nr:polymerase [Mycolicibacterium confluentis]